MIKLLQWHYKQIEQNLNHKLFDLHLTMQLGNPWRYLSKSSLIWKSAKSFEKLCLELTSSLKKVKCYYLSKEVYDKESNKTAELLTKKNQFYDIEGRISISFFNLENEGTKPTVSETKDLGVYHHRCLIIKAVRKVRD